MVIRIRKRGKRQYIDRKQIQRSIYRALDQLKKKSKSDKARPDGYDEQIVALQAKARYGLR